jgi:hypothetical protein
MSAVNLRAANNATFRFSRDLSLIAAAYPVASSIIRMQARISLSDPAPIYEWSSANVSGGVVAFDAATNIAVFAAPERDMATMQGTLAYDARIELPGGECVPLFSGRIIWTPGVTRITADAAAATGVSGVLDTVTIDGAPPTALVAQPATILLGVGAPATAPTPGQAFYYDTAGGVFYRPVSGAWVATTGVADLIGLVLDLSIPGNFWLM